MRLGITLAKKRFNLPFPGTWSWFLSQYYQMPSHSVELSKADAVLAYERYPSNAKLPVIWITGPTDVEGLRKRGVPEQYITREIEFKREANRKALVTVLTTHTKKLLFDRVIQPMLPTVAIPFFQPITPISKNAFQEKWAVPSPLRLLFLGREGNRKGLALVLEAYADLHKCAPGAVSMRVVCGFSDGVIPIPEIPGLVHELSVSHARALSLLREAHYLIMPSKFETYGWVYIEAMAQGAIPIAADSDTQRELMDGGRAGWLIPRTATAITACVMAALEDPQSARTLAERAHEFWKCRFAPEVIASQIAELSETAISRAKLG